MNQFVLGMVVLRLLSGSLEVLAAYIMYRLNSLEKALLVNSALAIVGPIVLFTTTSIGLVGLAGQLSFNKITWVIIGVTCIFIGVLKK